MAKSILVGKIKTPFIEKNDIKYAPIVYKGETRGYIIKKRRHKIIVSPGHKVSVEQARDFVSNLDWPPNDAEPWVIRLPHKIVTQLKKTVSNIFRKHSESLKNKRISQKTLMDFLRSSE